MCEIYLRQRKFEGASPVADEFFNASKLTVDVMEKSIYLLRFMTGICAEKRFRDQLVVCVVEGG
jgi:hypothetical protein